MSSPPTSFKLSIKEGLFTIVRLDAGQPLPAWTITEPGFLSMTRTNEEISIVCSETCRVPLDARQVAGWRLMKFEFSNGENNLSMSGVLSALAGPLAAARISIFAIFTFQTDYVLVKAEDLPQAIEVLKSIE